MTTDPDPQILQAVELPALLPLNPRDERVDLLVLLADARAIITQLQITLAEERRTWAPMQVAYEHDMAGQRRCRFKVLTLPEWIAQRVGRLNGDNLQAEDPGDVNDHTQEGE